MSTRARTIDGAREKRKTVVLGAMRNVCNCIQKSNFTRTYIHILMCNCSSFSTNTAYNAIDKREKRKIKKNIRYNNRESNLVVMIFRVFTIVYRIT